MVNIPIISHEIILSIPRKLLIYCEFNGCIVNVMFESLLGDDEDISESRERAAAKALTRNRYLTASKLHITALKLLAIPTVHNAVAPQDSSDCSPQRPNYPLASDAQIRPR